MSVCIAVSDAASALEIAFACDQWKGLAEI